MKIRATYKVLNILLALTLLSCNQTPETRSPGEPDSLRVPEREDTLSSDKVSTVLRQTDLDVEKFVALGEALLTNIQRKPIKLTFVSDTIRASEISRGNYYYNGLFTSSVNVIKRLSFDPGNGNSKLRFWYVEATYQDTISAKKTIEELYSLANGGEDEVNYIPGLTYTNDFVIRSDNKIYWLNSGCSYSFANHKKLAKLVMQSLQVKNIHDSIWCECGDVACE